jgi:hypothetical protein
MLGMRWVVGMAMTEAGMEVVMVVVVVGAEEEEEEEEEAMVVADVVGSEVAGEVEDGERLDPERQRIDMCDYTAVAHTCTKLQRHASVRHGSCNLHSEMDVLREGTC